MSLRRRRITEKSSGTPAACKGRVAKDHGGKSGGYRVFSFFADRQNPVFLFWLLDKTDEDTLTDEQEKTFKALTTILKKELRT